VPIRPEHYLENLSYERVGHIGVEEVGHRVDEDNPRILPSFRLDKAFWPEPYGEWVSTIFRGVEEG
jgi:hypothetical protein